MDTATKKKLVKEIDPANIYNRPFLCESCKGDIMHFAGCGTYRCPICGYTAMDDWGKVREYLYSHKYSTALDIANDLGIPRSEVNQMLRENKIEVSSGVGSLLTCDMCGRVIRSGRLCSNCEMSMHQNLEMQAKSRMYQKLRGRGQLISQPGGDDGQMHFANSRTKK